MFSIKISVFKHLCFSDRAAPQGSTEKVGNFWALFELFKLYTNSRLATVSDSLILHRVATDLENMENLENSGNLKNCQNLRENSGKFGFL